MNSAPAVTRLVSRKTLQRLQDRFALLGKVTVCICTTEGELITQPTWGSRFSELIGTSPRGRTTFAESIRICARSQRRQATCRCHHGMTLYATPIVHERKRLGVIIVGTRGPETPSCETVRLIAAEYDVAPEALLATAGQIDPYSGGAPEAIYRFADVLAEMVASLYGKADQIERQLSDLRAVHGLAELLAGTRDLQEILDITVGRVVEVMSVKACAIRLLNAETGELFIKAVHNLSDEYLNKGPVMLDESMIDAAAFAGHVVRVPDVRSDPRTRYPENARREGIVSALCAPLTYRGQTIGVIRVYTSRRHTFSASQESLLRSIGSQAAGAIIASRLWDEQAKAERVQRQVESAAEIQRRMLPSHRPKQPGLEFGCVYDPTLKVGGDFYDFVELPGGCLGVAVADVAGKGLPAALMMASIRAALRSHADGPGDVATVVARVNRHMCRDTSPGEFATLAYGVLSPDGRSFTYCNAGHVPPLILRENRFRELTSGGLVIGLCPEETYDRQVASLRPGDILFMVTDGVTEAMDFEGTAYGRERLLASILKHQALDAQQLAHQLLWDVRRFVGLADQSDDITIVVAKVR